MGQRRQTLYEWQPPFVGLVTVRKGAWAQLQRGQPMMDWDWAMMQLSMQCVR